MIADGAMLHDLACRYLSFLHYAFNEKNGRFRNLMGYDRRWLEEMGSEDSHGRALWGLGEAVALAGSEDIRAAAQMMFEKALPALADFTSPRAWAYALIGIHAYLRRFGGDSKVRRIREELAEKLFTLYRKNAQPDWPWIEDIVTYANGVIPQALILSGRWLFREEILQAGLTCLDWLMKIQTDGAGHFVPIGNNGWYLKGKERARFDQQPIEAQSMMDACYEAFLVTGDPQWIHQAQRCLEWFWGRNDLHIPLYDHKTGGCCDGLSADGPNRNQGAESTLVCFLSILKSNRFRSIQIAAETKGNFDTAVLAQTG
jgi:hypothetical protein